MMVKKRRKGLLALTQKPPETIAPMASHHPNEAREHRQTPNCVVDLRMRVTTALSLSTVALV